MALDVFLSRNVDARALTQVTMGGVAWSSHRSGVRRRVTQFVYEHPDTGAAFTIDSDAHELLGTTELSPLNARLNVGRPDCYGREVVGALEWISRRLGAELYLQQSDGAVPPVDMPGLLSAWRELNGAACQVLRERGAESTSIDRAVADAWWSWQWELSPTRAELEPILGFVPGLFLVQRHGQGPALRAWTWTTGQAQAMPDAETVLFLPDLSGSRPVLLDATRVMSALEPLLERHVREDGTELPYVPEARNEACQAVARQLADLTTPLDREFDVVAIHELREFDN